MTSIKNNRTGLEIAIIGMAGRFPGANNIDKFWDNLKNGIESISSFSDEELSESGVNPELLNNSRYIRAKGILDGIEYFDASFFDYTPKDAEIMDPQIRIFHECVWDSLEDAGYDPYTYKGNIGLYAGAAHNFYWEALALLSDTHDSSGTFESSQYLDKDFLSTRISYKLNLKGPSISIQTACSTSLVAVHVACRELLMGQCKIAVAGGISISMPEKSGYLYQEGMIMSPDGHCRAFDVNSNGTVGGNAAGVVVLKRLEDAIADGDHIYAVIKGTGINNDGSRKIGYTAPSIEGQAQLIKAVYHLAEIEPESITYLETHGTGTALGDPIEIQGLKQAFNTNRTGFCPIGSVKTNIGHTDRAAGIASLIKTVLALKHRQIPPSLHYTKSNPKIDFERSPFYVNTRLTEWKNDNYPLRAGVSSFGIGGTNAHVVLEEAPEREDSSAERQWKAILLSAKTASALDKMTNNLSVYLNQNPGVNLSDLAYTLQVGRGQLDYRRMWICSEVSQAIENLVESGNPYFVENENENLVFMFPGQGSQYIHMGLDLYENEPQFRQIIDHCFEISKSMGVNLREVIYPQNAENEHKINETRFTQPILFIFEYALAKLLMDWGIKPQAMIGHSIGEYVAACLSGVMSLEDALSLVIFRGVMMSELPTGAMLSIPLGEEEFTPFLNDQISLAAVNSSALTVVSGPMEAIADLKKKLQEKGIEGILIHTSHAFHSWMMDPVLKRYEERVRQIQLNKPEIPYISNLTGNWITLEDAVNPEYWVKHLRNTVRFADGISRLLNDRMPIFIEVGPGRTLCEFIKQHKNTTPELLAINLVKHPREKQTDGYHLWERIARLWCAGIKINWGRVYAGEKRYRVSLPTYPFEKQYYTIKGNPFVLGKNLIQEKQSLFKKEDMTDWFYAPTWEQSPFIFTHSGIQNGNWLVFVDELNVGFQLVEKLKQKGQNVTIVSAGLEFAKVSETEYTICPAREIDYANLILEIKSLQRVPQYIIHLWGITEQRDLNLDDLDMDLNRGVYSLLNIAKAIGKHNITSPIQIKVITNQMQEVIGGELLYPQKATILGPVKVIPLEYLNIECSSIDIVLSAPNRQKLLDNLFMEIITGSTDKVVAYRGDYRWIPNYKPVRLHRSNEVDSKLREKGIYIVIGGFGGMGLTIAEYLAKTVKARLILIGRSSFPKRPDWKDWLTVHAPDDETSLKISKIMELEKLGSVIMPVCADVADHKQMQAVIMQVKEQFGEVNGVIHAAGVIDYGGVIQRRTKEMTDNVIAAKVKGTVVLHEIVKEFKLDFLILFSSLGNQVYKVKFGQVGYNIANEFLDAFTYYKSGKDNTNTVTINWSDWLEVGMTIRSLQAKHQDQKSFKSNLPKDAITPREGIEVFKRILGYKFKHVLVSTVDLNGMIEKMNLATRKEQMEFLSHLIFTNAKRVRPNLDHQYMAPGSEAEEMVAQIFEELTSIDHIGVEDNFFDIGGNSLKAISLVSKINKIFDIEVPLAIIFENPTPKGIAGYISQADQKVFESIQSVEEKEYYPVSSAQKRMYILNLLEELRTGYNMLDVVILEGELDRDRFNGAFTALIKRHESLRTSFELINGEPVQQIHQSVEFAIDYQEADESGVAEILQAFIRPFDLKKAPLLRVKLVKIADAKYVLMYDLHHIISDGISMDILIREFAVLYEDRALPELRIQYKDYAIWQNEMIKTGKIKQQEDYWLQTFSGELPVLNLSTDYPRPAAQSFDGAGIRFTIDPELTGRIYQIAAETGATVYMILLAAINILLYKYTNQEDVIIGSPIAGRPHADLEKIIGMFVNTLAMRNFPNRDKTFTAFLAEVKENSLKAYENQDYQFEELVEKVNARRDFSRNPLFDVMFVLQNTSMSTRQMQTLKFSPYPFKNHTAKFDLTLTAVEMNATIQGSFEYCTKLFKPETIARFIGHWQNILEAITTHPEVKLAELEILTEAEKRQILYDFNDTQAEYPQTKTIHQLFDEQAERTPDNIAVVFGEQRLTYKELNAKTNQLAQILREKGVKSDDIVGIMVERSVEMIYGALAVLKAGGAYLPIDPGYPAERIRYMIEDSRASILLTQGKFNAEKWAGEQLCLDETNLYRGETSNLKPVNISKDLAYLIYTSGTTGRPKGAMIEHRNVVRLLFNNRNRFDFKASDTWTMFHSFCFDFSVWEMYGALLYGGKLIVIPKFTAQDPKEYLKLLERERVTILNQTPSMFYNIASEALKDKAPDLALRYVIFGGEALQPIMLKKWHEQYPDIRLINMYGITETTVHVTYKEITKAEIESNISNIGTPIPTLTTYIMDRYLKLVPVGVPGELCVGGAGVGRGYLNRDELTAQKFINNPYLQNERLYRSGDLVRLLSGGDLEYLGRIDHQVKIRGHRIELGEIEARLLKHEAIQETIVIAKEDENGGKYLCAYFTGNRELTVQDVRNYLAGGLPEYMIPSYFVQLEKLPLTPNGKVDRKQLPEPQGYIHTGMAYVAPRDEIEAKLAGLWQEILGAESLGIDDNFFEIGGHSLKATILVSRVHKAFNTELSLREVFLRPTIREQAEYLKQATGNIYVSIQPVTAYEAYPAGCYPLSAAQKRLYVLSRFEGAGTSYNLPGAVNIEGELDRTRLEAVFQELIRRHDSLRTSFELWGGEPVQRIHPTIDFGISYPPTDEIKITEKLKTFIRPFDLRRAPLLRVELVEISAAKHVLMYDLHHIISDGVSMDILIQEFIGLYEGQQPPELRIQYKDYAVWQNELLVTGKMNHQEDYWLQTFSGELPVLNLPVDYPRPAIQSFEGDRIEFEMSPEITGRIHRMATETGATVYMILLAAINVLLSKYTGQEDIVIGTPIAGRPHADLEKIIGMFVNTLAMRNFPNRDKTFTAFLAEVKENSLIAYENQDYQFEELVEKVNVRRDLSRNPLFDVMFVLQNTSMSTRKMQTLKFSPYPFENHTAKFDLTFTAVEVNTTIQGSFEYCTKLFKPETITRFTGHWQNILEAITAHPEVKLAELELITETEKRQILIDFNDTRAEYPNTKTIQELFEEQTVRTPGNIAVIFEDRQLTYGELNQKSNQLARLLREKGIKPDCIVGIMVDRSLEMMIGIMGILKAGGAYLPIDPGYPADRIRYILEDSAAPILLTQGEERVQGLFPGETINLVDERLYQGEANNLDKINSPESLAYVIYTSGSTGKPKGIMIEHYSVVNRIHWMQKQYPLTENDVILQKTPFTFDVSVWELFWWSIYGAKVSFLIPGGEKDPGQIIATIVQNRITTLHFVPSMLNIFLDYLEEHDDISDGLSSLRQVFASGEALNLRQVEKFNEIINARHGTKLHNLYGPTEATVDVSYFDCSTGAKLETVPIGKPIDNINLYIVDQHHKLQPIGVTGELCIAGDGLARGYLNKKELTLEKFVPNPFNYRLHITDYKLNQSNLENLNLKSGICNLESYSRMYKTGDLARWLPDGNIEYLGRIDHQVKIRGFRIELGEIENQLLKEPSIKETIVVAKDDPQGGKYLCAYLTSDREWNVSELQESLSKELPDYMIPSYFIKLEKMPLSANGKIDRKALPEPKGNIHTGSEYLPPRDEIEERLVEIWQDLLGVSPIGILDNFFTLGGHSLKATILTSRIYKDLNVELPLKEIFKTPTIKDLAAYIKAAESVSYSAIEPIARQEFYPVSSAQKRLYFIGQMAEAGTSYNMPGVMVIEGDLNRERLEAAFQGLTGRHEAFRTSFEMIEGAPVQRIYDRVELVTNYREALEAEIDNIVRAFIHPFDLAKAPLLRESLVKLSESKHLLLYDMHHIIADGISMDILVREFLGLYDGKSLPELRIQYKDYAAWQNELVRSGRIQKQEAYWRQTFSGELPVLNLPTDYPRPAAPSFEGAQVHFETGPELKAGIHRLATATGMTVYMVLLAAYNILLARYSGQEDIIVGSPIAGRSHADLENIIGMFVNTLAMRNYPSGYKTCAGFLEEVKDNTLQAIQNQDYQFEELVDQLNLPRNLSRNPLFDVVFVLQTWESTASPVTGLQFTSYPFQNETAKFDITLQALEDKETIDFSFEYRTRLFRSETMERMANDYLKILAMIVSNTNSPLNEIKLQEHNFQLDWAIKEEVTFDF